MSDPRVFFAAERTLLAWIRTGLTIIGLGFVVSRLRVLAQSSAEMSIRTLPPGVSALLGALLTGLGTVAIIMATMQFRAFVSSLGATELPPRYRANNSVVLAYLIAAVGAALTIYLFP